MRRRPVPAARCHRASHLPGRGHRSVSSRQRANGLTGLPSLPHLEHKNRNLNSRILQYPRLPCNLNDWDIGARVDNARQIRCAILADRTAPTSRDAIAATRRGSDAPLSRPPAIHTLGMQASAPRGVVRLVALVVHGDAASATSLARCRPTETTCDRVGDRTGGHPRPSGPAAAASQHADRTWHRYRRDRQQRQVKWRRRDRPGVAHARSRGRLKRSREADPHSRRVSRPKARPLGCPARPPLPRRSAPGPWPRCISAIVACQSRWSSAMLSTAPAFGPATAPPVQLETGQPDGQQLGPVVQHQHRTADIAAQEPARRPPAISMACRRRGGSAVGAGHHQPVARRSVKQPAVPSRQANSTSPQTTHSRPRRGHSAPGEADRDHQRIPGWSAAPRPEELTAGSPLPGVRSQHDRIVVAHRRRRTVAATADRSPGHWLPASGVPAQRVKHVGTDRGKPLTRTRSRPDRAGDRGEQPNWMMTVVSAQPTNFKMGRRAPSEKRRTKTNHGSRCLVVTVG